jgi:hypothetical protein
MLRHRARARLREITIVAGRVCRITRQARHLAMHKATHDDFTPACAALELMQNNGAK